MPELAPCFLDSRRWREIALLFAHEVNSNSQAFRTALLLEANLKVLPPYEYQSLTDELRKCANDLEKQDSHNAGLLYYSVGNMISNGTYDYGQALECFEAALRLIPQYDKQEYFCIEMGATLFETGRLEEAALWYRKAVDMAVDKGHPTACLADTLAFLGRYAEAACIWSESSVSSLSGTHWSLKNSAIKILQDIVKMPEQKRDGAKAREILATSGDLQAALRADALEPECWRRFVEDALSREDVEALMAGWRIMDAFSLDHDEREQGRPVWMVLSMLAFHEKADELFRGVLESAWHQSGEARVMATLGSVSNFDDIDLSEYFIRCESIFADLRRNGDIVTIRSFSEEHGLEESIVITQGPEGGAYGSV